MESLNPRTCKRCGKPIEKKRCNQCREKIDYVENPHRILRGKKAPDVFFGY